MCSRVMLVRLRLHVLSEREVKRNETCSIGLV